MAQPIVLAHVVWMDRYIGDTDTIFQASWDFVGGSHHAENSGERFIFYPIDGECLGYVPRFTKGRHKTLTLERLSSSAKGKDQYGPITVIWTATPPWHGDRVVVGWYTNATAYRNPKEFVLPDKERVRIYFKASSIHATCLPPQQRKFTIQRADAMKATEGPGQDSIYYASDRAPRLAQRLQEYIQKEKTSSNLKNSNSFNLSNGKRPHQTDTEKRLAVEEASMRAVASALEFSGWTVKDVSAKKLGWDLDANFGNFQWLVEVKGLSGATPAVELTPQEYKCFGAPRGSGKPEYILAIVTDALDRRRQTVTIFRKTKQGWFAHCLSSGGIAQPQKELVIAEAVAARIRAIEH